MGTYNIKETYLEKYDTRLGILVASELEIGSTENRLKFFIVLDNYYLSVILFS